MWFTVSVTCNFLFMWYTVYGKYIHLKQENAFALRVHALVGQMEELSNTSSGQQWEPCLSLGALCSVSLKIECHLSRRLSWILFLSDFSGVWIHSNSNAYMGSIQYMFIIIMNFKINEKRILPKTTFPLFLQVFLFFVNYSKTCSHSLPHCLPFLSKISVDFPSSSNSPKWWTQRERREAPGTHSLGLLENTSCSFGHTRVNLQGQWYQGMGTIKKGMSHTCHQGNSRGVYSVTQHAVGIVVNKLREKSLPRKLMYVWSISSTLEANSFLKGAKENDEKMKAATEKGTRVHLKLWPAPLREAHFVRTNGREPELLESAPCEFMAQ